VGDEVNVEELLSEVPNYEIAVPRDLAVHAVGLVHATQHISLVTIPARLELALPARNGTASSLVQRGDADVAAHGGNISHRGHGLLANTESFFYSIWQFFYKSTQNRFLPSTLLRLMAKNL
jgi:hypothetical protein